MSDKPSLVQHLENPREETAAPSKDHDAVTQLNQAAAVPHSNLKTLSRFRIGIPLGAAVLLGAIGPQPFQDWCIAVGGVVVCQILAARAAAFVDLAAGLWRPKFSTYAQTATSILTALILLSVGSTVHSSGVMLSAAALLATSLVWPFAERAIIRNTGFVR